jgi:hypothetical protein
MTIPYLDLSFCFIKEKKHKKFETQVDKLEKIKYIVHYTSLHNTIAIRFY